MASKVTMAVAAVCLAASTLAACGSPDAGSSTTLTLTFSTKEPSFDFGLIGGVAKGAGLFEDEGLDVKLETASGGSATVQSLVAGQSDVVTAVPSDVMAANQNSDADVKCFDANTTGFNLFPAVAADSKLTTYGDLAGHKVAVASLATSTITVIKAMAKREGADPEKITFVPITPGTTAIHALQSGEVDALGYWDTQYAVMGALGLKLRPIHAREDIEDPSFALCYATTTEWLEKNPKVAAAFGRAAARAYVFIKTNPEAAARITLDMYPQLHSSSGDTKSDVENGVTQMKGRLPYMAPVDGKIGYVTQAQVQNAIDLQVEAGLIEEGLKPSDIWTDELINEINKIDQQEAENRAKDYKE